MRFLVLIWIAILFVACKKPENSNFMNCDPVFDESNYFANCGEILDTTGLKLYQFVPFTDEEWWGLSFDEKLELRQIPEDFMRGMSTAELFYQFHYCDLPTMFGHNTFQQDFENSTRLNMIQELVKRPDTGHNLLKILQKVDPSVIDMTKSCAWWYHTLLIIASQAEIINNMTDEDICNYIHQQLRAHDIIRKLSLSNDGFWEGTYTGSVCMLIYGLGNVLIRYKYEPFIQTLYRHPVTDELIWVVTHSMTEERFLEVINFVEQFINLTSK